MRERPDKAVLTTDGCCEERGGLFKCQERSKSSFHHCGSPVRLVPACLNAGKRSETAVLTTVEEL